jgi:osmoprotectant transport system permease protein
MTAIVAGSGLYAGGNGLGGVPTWFSKSENWWGENGLVLHIRDHLIYSAIILVVATVIALPVGLLIGHTGRGVILVAGIANGLRAVPTLGLVVLLYVWLSPKIPVNHDPFLFLPKGTVPVFIPVVIVLVLLAIPAILTNTYAGVQAVDPAVRDAARGMGMSGWQIVRQVEFPCALPLIMSGLRSATLQVIATVTVAAYLPLLGGLGSFISAGEQALNDPEYGYPAMVAAGIVVALLAVLIDALLNLVQRLVVSPGVSGRFSRGDGSAHQPGVTTAPIVEAQLTVA